MLAITISKAFNANACHIKVFRKEEEFLDSVRFQIFKNEAFSAVPFKTGNYSWSCMMCIMGVARIFFGEGGGNTFKKIFNKYSKNFVKNFVKIFKKFAKIFKKNSKFFIKIYKIFQKFSKEFSLQKC